MSKCEIILATKNKKVSDRLKGAIDRTKVGIDTVDSPVKLNRLFKKIHGIRSQQPIALQKINGIRSQQPIALQDVND